MSRLPEQFKVKLPPINTPELDAMYDFLFDIDRGVVAGWAGKLGHYAYGEGQSVAKDQDGHVYCWKSYGCGYRISASSEAGKVVATNAVLIEPPYTEW